MIRTEFFTKNFLAQSSSQELINHGMGGWLYNFQKQKNPISVAYQNEWLKTTYRNHLIKSELNQIQNLWSKSAPSPILLKGISLIDFLYKDYGLRPLSDCDLLIEPEHMDLFNPIFEKMGYYLLKEKKWRGNNFKRTFKKKLGLNEVVFEVHTRLFYHVNFSFYESTMIKKNSFFRTLLPEVEFTYLCGHVGFQHTFVKLFWLLDLLAYLDLKILNYDKVLSLAKKWKIFNSLKAVSILEKNYGGNSSLFKKVRMGWFESQLFSFLLAWNQLLKPNSVKWRYYFLKHKLKDQPIESFKYGALWLIQKLQKK